MSRVAGRTARVTIAVSQAAADSARRDDHIPEDRLRVALNGIPDLRPVSSAEVVSLKGVLGIGSDDLVVVILARSRPEKGHTVLVHAMSTAAAHVAKPLHLVSVGSGPHDPVIRDACSKASSFRSHLVGHQEDVALWLNLAHVVVAPSLVEPFGLSTIEAMAAAKPVVASGVEGLDEVVVEGRTGLKVPPGDPIALAGALSSLLSDRDARDRMGLAGRARYLDLFTIDKMVARWLDVYREVIPSLDTPTVL
jgi:glycosyltransferase involved in cell wall biosynthesis